MKTKDMYRETLGLCIDKVLQAERRTALTEAETKRKEQDFFAIVHKMAQQRADDINQIDALTHDRDATKAANARYVATVSRINDDVQALENKMYRLIVFVGISNFVRALNDVPVPIKVDADRIRAELIMLDSIIEEDDIAPRLRKELRTISYLLHLELFGTQTYQIGKANGTP